MNRWERIDDVIGRVEQMLIAFLLSAMILLVFSQIVLRNFFSTGISWGDALVRYLVLWVGFIGAALATREGRHINIEVFSHWMSDRSNIILEAVTNLVSAIICGLLAYAAVNFIRFEAQMGSTSFLHLPVWVPELILPVTFGLMSLRFAMRIVSVSTGLRNPDLDRKREKEL